MRSIFKRATLSVAGIVGLLAALGAPKFRIHG